VLLGTFLFSDNWPQVNSLILGRFITEFSQFGETAGTPRLCQGERERERQKLIDNQIDDLSFALNLRALYPTRPALKLRAFHLPMMQTIDMLNTYMLNQELHEQQRIGPGSNMYLYILSVYIYRLYDSSRPPGCHCIIEIMHSVSEIVVRLRWTLLQRSIKLQRPLSCNLIVAL
jgi:hypothetical protein